MPFTCGYNYFRCQKQPEFNGFKTSCFRKHPNNFESMAHTIVKGCCKHQRRLIPKSGNTCYYFPFMQISGCFFKSRFLSLPNSGNNGFAKFAFIIDQVISGNVITLALNQQFFTVVAIGIITFMARHITEIDIADSFLHG